MITGKHAVDRSCMLSVCSRCLHLAAPTSYFMLLKLAANHAAVEGPRGAWAGSRAPNRSPAQLLLLPGATWGGS
jgi:hypothetical protein